jgi:hypothetical protein
MLVVVARKESPLHRVSFIDGDDDEAFGFLDLQDVI